MIKYAKEIRNLLPYNACINNLIYLNILNNAIKTRYAKYALHTYHRSHTILKKGLTITDSKLTYDS